MKNRPDFTEQIREMKYNPIYVTSDAYNTKLTVLKYFEKSIAIDLFCTGFPVYKYSQSEGGKPKELVTDISQIRNHEGAFCTEKRFSNIIGVEKNKTGIVGSIDYTVMSSKGEEQAIIIYFDLDSFIKDIRKSRDLAVPIDVQYFDLQASSTKPRNKFAYLDEYE